MQALPEGHLIEMRNGTIPIIMSIPHGGLLDPDDIPDRSCQCANPGHQKCPVILQNDGYTIDLGEEIAHSIKLHTSCHPYVVINHLRRSKLDPNRQIHIAAQNNHQAMEAFNEYHEWLENTRLELQRGLLIDLHGRGKADGMIQLGYCLKGSSLISDQYDTSRSSIADLAKENPDDDLITGPNSLGAFLQQEGLQALPSPTHRAPGSSEVYFSGGYITQRHGNQGIDGIQVEIPRDLRIDGGEEGRTRVGHALGKAISDFYHFHYLQLNKVK